MRKLKLLVITLLVFVLPKNVFAASVSVKASSNTIYRGDSVTITATVSADAGIYTTTGSVYCSGAGVNTGIDLKYEDMNTANKSFSKTLKITPTSSGAVTCKTSGVKIRELSKESEYGLSDSSVTINVKNKEAAPSNNNGNSNSNNTGGTTADKKEYDSDNTLKSLEVEGYKLTPEFKKDVLEYKLEVDESVEKVNVKAVTSSDKAEVSGGGEKKLTPGDNTIEIKVTAENGNEKKYKIFVTVKDQYPITVVIDNNKYTIVKKNNDILDKLDGYEEEVIKIKDQDVVSYVNKVTKVRLVILKNDKNEPGFYIYNEHSEEYSNYRYVVIGNITLQLLDPVKKLKYFTKYDIIVKNEKVGVYKIKESDKIGLIYGTNIKTGNTDYYVYDPDEDTITRYYSEEVKAVNKELEDFKNREMLFMGIAAGVTIVSIMSSIIVAIKGRKKRINYR